MKIQTVLLMMGLVASSSVSAKVHVHDEAALLIGQGGQNWHLHFTVPASNAFGFERAPKNMAELTAVRSFLAKIKKVENVVKVDGNCSVLEFNENITSSGLLAKLDDEHEHEHEHEKHGEYEYHDDEHEHHDEHDHHKHHDDHEPKNKNKTVPKHFDAQFDFLLECQKPISHFQLTLFDSVKSLYSVSAQWVLESGVGKKEVTSKEKTLRLEAR